MAAGAVIDSFPSRHTENPPLTYKVYPVELCYREVYIALNCSALRNQEYGGIVIAGYVSILVLPQDISTYLH